MEWLLAVGVVFLGGIYFKMIDLVAASKDITTLLHEQNKRAMDLAEQLDYDLSGIRTEVQAMREIADKHKARYLLERDPY